MKKCANCGGPVTEFKDHQRGNEWWTCVKDDETWAWFSPEERRGIPNGITFDNQ